MDATDPVDADGAIGGKRDVAEGLGDGGALEGDGGNGNMDEIEDGGV